MPTPPSASTRREMLNTALQSSIAIHNATAARNGKPTITCTFK